jgi:hypothetical protein
MSLSVLATAQSKARPLPCSFPGELLHNDKGQPVWFTSDQMKEKAAYRADVSSFLKQADIKGTAIVDVLVNSSGEVACVKSLTGHPMIRVEVEKALKKWTFKPASQDGRTVAYLGEMEFKFCNISCGDDGPSMTLLK